MAFLTFPVPAAVKKYHQQRFAGQRSEVIMCISSPSKNITIRRRRQKHRSNAGNTSYVGDATCIACSPAPTTFKEQFSSSSDEDEEFMTSIFSPSGGEKRRISSSDEDGEFIATSSIFSPSREERRRISDEHDIAACKSATKHLQDVVPIMCSSTENESESSEEESVEPVELFSAPQSKLEASSEGRMIKIWKTIFAILGMLELCTLIYPRSCISTQYAGTINHFFMTALIIHSINSAKTAAFSYSEQSTSARSSFDRAESKRTMKQKWTTERLHLFTSFLLFRVILLPIFKSDKKNSKKIHSIAETALLKVQSMLHIQSKHIISSLKSHVTKEIAVLALTNPFTLKVRLYQLFTFIRWAKFIAPLIGALNKFKGHCVDLHRKWSQRRRSKRAQLAWDTALQAVVAKHRFDDAVLRIQRNFRARRESKTERRMCLMLDRRGKQSAARIQQRLQEEAARAREGIARIDKVISEASKRRVISEKDKKNMRNHMDGVRRNRVFLFRPNTNFAVTWKVITVTCVFLEVSSIAFAPRLSGEMKTMSTDQFVQTCAAFLFGSYKSDATITWAAIANHLADAFSALVSLLSFLDVFITFLTGELCPETGSLVPKPFFTRWVLPGVCLQLLINPAMKETSRRVRDAAMFANSIGWARVLNVFLAIRPPLQFLCGVAVECLHRFIEMENRKISVSFIA